MATTGGLFRTVVKNAAVLLSGKAANAVITLAAFGVAARGLGLQQFGLLILIHAYAEAVGDIAKFQSWQSVLHYGAKPLGESRLHDFQRVLRFSALLDVLSAIGGIAIGLVLAGFVGPWLKWPPGTAPMAMLYVTSAGFMVSATPFGVLRLFGRFDLMARQTAVAALVWLAGGAVAFWLHAGLGAYLLAWWAGTFAAFVYLAGAAWRELHRQGALEGLDWRKGHLTEGFPGLWRFALTTNASATLEMVFTHVSTLIVGGLLNPGQAALWRIAKTVADAIAAPAKLVTPALYPELAKLRAAGDNHTLGQLALRIAGAGGALGLVLLAIAAAFGGPALGLIMGKAFAAAGPVLTWQTGAAVIGIWALPLEPMLISTGRAGQALWARLVVSAIYLFALAPMVAKLGLIGVGATSVGAEALMAAGMLLGVLHWYRDPRTGLVGRAPPPEALT
jgi:O-antigen/teichoic acid export membrane protein